MNSKYRERNKYMHMKMEQHSSSLSLERGKIIDLVCNNNISKQNDSSNIKKKNQLVIIITDTEKVM